MREKWQINWIIYLRPNLPNRPMEKYDIYMTKNRWNIPSFATYFTHPPHILSDGWDGTGVSCHPLPSKPSNHSIQSEQSRSYIKNCNRSGKQSSKITTILWQRNCGLPIIMRGMGEDAVRTVRGKWMRGKWMVIVYITWIATYIWQR